MIRIKPSYDCLESKIGLRGVCDESETSCYVDGLPGINLISFTKIANPIEFRPEDIFKKARTQAAKQVTSHFKRFMAKYFQVKSIIQDESIKLSGSHEFYGELDEFVGIYIDVYNTDKFCTTKVFGFRIVSDRDVIGKKFYVETDRDEKKECLVNLKKGVNNIDISVETESEFIRLSFDVSNFKIGIRDRWKSYAGGCCCAYDSPCDMQKCAKVYCQTSLDGCTWENTSTYFGFDLCVQCKCSNELIACYFADELELAMQYRTGINSLQEAKMSNNINNFTQNKELEIKELLHRWLGGVDMGTGLKAKGEYWEEIRNAVEQTRHSIAGLKSKCFCCNVTTLESKLPG